MANFNAALDVDLEIKTANVGTRGFAFAIDLLICSLISFAGMMAIFSLFAFIKNETFLIVIAIIFVFIVQWTPMFLMEVLMNGQTVGKKILRLKVVTLQGANPNIGQLLIRNFMRTIDFLPGAYAAGVLSIIVDKHSRRLGDLAAGTIVMVIEQPNPILNTLKWPDGFRGEDVILVEKWFSAVETLLPDKKEELAKKLYNKIKRDYPELTKNFSKDIDPMFALYSLFSGD